MMSGPYGDFHPNFTSGKEMIWIGGGAGMAPLRAQIMHMTKKPSTLRDREMHFFYGARSLSEAFFLEDFWELERRNILTSISTSLSTVQTLRLMRVGVKYYTGFAVNCIRDEYLKGSRGTRGLWVLSLWTSNAYQDSYRLSWQHRLIRMQSCTITLDNSISYSYKARNLIGLLAFYSRKVNSYLEG